MKRLLHNWQLKILSLLSAVILWFFVVGIENTIYVFPEEMDVLAINVPKNITLAEDLPRVKLYLRVDGNIAKTLTKNDFEAVANLSGLSAGDYQLPVAALSKNPQVTVLKTSPEKISVKLAPIAEKEVQVRTELRGSPAQGYTVKEIKTEDGSVKVSAAQSVLDKIQNVNAVLLLDGSESGLISRKVALEIPQIAGANTAGITITPEETLLTAEIVPELSQKTLKITPVLTGTGATEELIKQLVLTPESITVQGEEKALQALTEIKTEPLDATGLLEAPAPTGVKLILPENVTLTDPAQKITVQLDAQQEQKTVLAPVVFTGENPSFAVKKVTPSQVKVTLIGPASQIKDLKAADVTVNINLQNVKAAGALQINIGDITVPEGLKVTSFEPDQITLE